MKLIFPRIEQCYFKFEPRDLWLGVFWDPKDDETKIIDGHKWWAVVHFYIIVIPTLPLFVEVWFPLQERRYMTETRETYQAVIDVAVSEEIVRLRERCAELQARVNILKMRTAEPKSTREKARAALEMASSHLVGASQHGQFDQWMSYFLETLEADIDANALSEVRRLIDERLERGGW